jgi:hypothetical protein
MRAILRIEGARFLSPLLKGYNQVGELLKPQEKCRCLYNHHNTINQRHIANRFAYYQWEQEEVGAILHQYLETKPCPPDMGHFVPLPTA